MFEALEFVPAPEASALMTTLSAPDCTATADTDDATPPVRGGTGIVLLNLGGPKTLDEVEPFLLRLFADREIIQLPVQDLLGPFIARRRAPKVRTLYDAIGGGSPILHWTETQGRAMCARLDRLSPATAPHRFYVAFRYTAPFSDDAVRAMHRDGITRAVAFTQYPHWSCATTGSSLNELWRALDRTGLRDQFQWSVIDRWPVHEGFVAAMAEATAEALATVPAAQRDTTPILFSAHSLPLRVVDRGDAYPAEVGATAMAIMQRLQRPNPWMVTYQSEVGPVRWLGPSTETTIEQLGHRGERALVVVPVAFTSDHIETLSELDLEYGALAAQVGITHYVRAGALNDRPAFLDALADLVRTHLASGAPHSTQYRFRCPGCTNPACRQLPAGAAAVTGAGSDPYAAPSRSSRPTG